MASIPSPPQPEPASESVRLGAGLTAILVAAYFGFIGLSVAELPWRATHPNLARLSERLERRSSFRATVPYAQTIADRVV